MKKIKYHNRSAYRKCIGLIIASLLLLLSGCESFIDTEPPAFQINSLNVFNQDGTAISAVTEMYGKVVSNLAANPSNNLSLSGGLSADELTLFDAVTDQFLVAFYRNELISNAGGSRGGGIWTLLYQGILAANTSMEGLNASTGLYPVVKKQLLGECYFMRAFYYFYLINLYGDVPLALTSDPNINNGLPRAGQAKVYEQIVADLLKARDLLNPNYVGRDMLPYALNAERVRPNRAAATALLARVYLYMGNQDAATEATATEVINQTDLYGLLPLNDMFLKNSREAIWQLQPVRNGRNTDNGFMFVLPEQGPNGTTTINGNPVSLNIDLVNAFDAGDIRAEMGNWINSVTTPSGLTYHYPFKYKVKAVAEVSEYEMVLRLAEQYLIRAEARAMQNKLTGPNSAASDLNIIRERAGLPPTTATTQTELLDAILKERRVELFAEWGHRWLDLKRTGKVDEVMEVATGEKGSTWRSFQQWYPLPYNDILRGPNLKQNPGYQ